MAGDPLPPRRKKGEWGGRDAGRNDRETVGEPPRSLLRVGRDAPARCRWLEALLRLRRENDGEAATRFWEWTIFTESRVDTGERCGNFRKGHFGQFFNRIPYASASKWDKFHGRSAEWLGALEVKKRTMTRRRC